MSEATCRGSFALGTACGKCSRCRREIESYNAMKAVRDKLNTPSSALARIEELEAKLSESEALLAKAVEALELLHDNVVQAWPSVADLGPVANARTTLAELTGGKDE